jgi:hypothetical protein
MTDEELTWLTCEEVPPLLAASEETISARKLRLFGCACCRRIWHLLHHGQYREAVLAAERFAEGLVSIAECESAGDAAAQIADTSKVFVDSAAGCAVSWASSTGPREWNAATWSLASAMQSVVYHAALACEERVQEETRQCDLVRDIFGNPFRTLAFSPSWRTDTAIALARQMYDSREFGAMPILADALQDAGCDNTDILAHCRDATHVRGCWVVDLVLGKE